MTHDADAVAKALKKKGFEAYGGDHAVYKQPGEILCYSRAFLPEADLDRCEAALIFEHRDVLVNIRPASEFDYDATHVVAKGRNKFLHADFWVRCAN